MNDWESKYEAERDYSDTLSQSLSLAHNACGIAATFLKFHGRPSKELENCIDMMQRHDEIGRAVLAAKRTEARKVFLKLCGLEK